MKKKILALCLVIALAATAVIGGTLAYFTDTADAKNTFTVGKLSIDLDEKTWDAENAMVYPGAEIAKNPTITVLDGSVECYVRAVVEMPKEVYEASNLCADNEDVKISFVGDHADFEIVGVITGDTVKVVYQTTGTVDASSGDEVLSPLFTSVNFDAVKITNKDDALYTAMGAEFNVVVNAYAIQADLGKTDIDDAFDAAFAGVFTGMAAVTA